MKRNHKQESKGEIINGSESFVGKTFRWNVNSNFKDLKEARTFIDESIGHHLECQQETNFRLDIGKRYFIRRNGRLHLTSFTLDGASESKHQTSAKH